MRVNNEQPRMHRNGATASRTRNAFTLVELLVVIGIIAVLISMLLPALNRARQSANLVKCQSNLRQIQLAVQIYASQNRDVVPWGTAQAVAGYRADGSYHGITYAERIQETLSRIIGKNNVDHDYGAAFAPVRAKISEVFQDADTNYNGLRHYTANVRVYGNHGTPSGSIKDVYREAQGGTGQFLPAKFSQMRPSSEVASFFCSNETSVAWTAATHPINREAAATDSVYIDNGGAYKHGFIRGWLPPGFPSDHHEQLIYAPNIKTELPGGPGPTNAPGIRTRHMGNKLANIVFMDGHVQSFRYDEMKRKLFCVPPPKL